VPGAAHEIIGIRPGEKLHEVMVPREDGRLTLEFDDHYVIEPAFQFWDRETYQTRHGGSAVDHEFHYSSDTNTEWLTGEQLRAIAG
jgi:UDP-N-acetylglucosamine 4,6-dehydratase